MIPPYPGPDKGDLDRSGLYNAPMRIIEERMPLEELTALARTGFGDLVKAVVDVERGVMAVAGELHADEEALLLESGSRPEDLWGINLYPDLEGPDRIEFDSMINIRPSRGNHTRGVDDPEVQQRIREVVARLVGP